VQVAAAKGGQLLSVAAMAPELALDQDEVRDAALADGEVADLLAGRDYDFLYAHRLGFGESGGWRDQGCGRRTCALATFFDYTVGDTVEAVVEVISGRVLDRWRVAGARPGPSARILPRAVDIAARDQRVQQVLGDIHGASLTMVPMAAWLRDDACGREWCVDLTYHAPDDSGRVFHVFVNMQRGQVARTFYTRARAEHSYKNPAAQGDFFQDGCHEEYGWNVCWEMTANDGINFYDATYEEQLIFSSVKVGQVEVWYPSWPGGYRDEIGFSASVPPHYGTHVTDLGAGFEVRQLYTEFTRWPNCICCYRYEQVMRFFADGAFESRFVSHGPGCDDPSVYRPFYRIDLDLNGSEDDEVWAWTANQWAAIEREHGQELFAGLTAEGQRLAVFDGDLHYRWVPEKTDPLGLDEGQLFFLRFNEGEGEGPIATGPADTFEPPRQWLNDEPVSGGNSVFWYVPILKTKKGGPWWCMPDPDPVFSPCEAVLRFVPGGELEQPTLEEVVQATPSATPTTAAVTATPEATATPRPIEGEDAETIILNSGCGSCHAIGALGEVGKVGPDLSNIGVEAGQRVAAQSAEEYLHESIVAPDDFIVPDCPNGPCLPGIMPPDFEHRLSNEQLSTLVAFLLEQRGQAPAPTPSLPAAVGADTSRPAATGADQPSQGEVDARSLALVLGLSAGIVTLLALGRLVARRRQS
jgi:hypothetical protein